METFGWLSGFPQQWDKQQERESFLSFVIKPVLFYCSLSVMSAAAYSLLHVQKKIEQVGWLVYYLSTFNIYKQALSVSDPMMSYFTGSLHCRSLQIVERERSLVICLPNANFPYPNCEAMPNSFREGKAERCNYIDIWPKIEFEIGRISLYLSEYLSQGF